MNTTINTVKQLPHMQFDFSKVFLSKGVNYATDDLPLVAFSKYLDFHPDRDMVDLGLFISERLIESACYIDSYSRPVLKSWGLLGEREDSVWLSPDHRLLLKQLQDFGVIRKSIEQNDMFYHFISGYLVSDSGLFCTLTLTAQTAYALKKYGHSAQKKDFLHQYLDTKDPWYGATYYTETQGGSDLGSNNTVAEEEHGKWRISGQDKYFASNSGIADGALVTAKIAGAIEGAKGISLFFVPSRREDGSSNYRVTRLKNKLGTIAVPTGEVEFDNSEGYLIGDKSKGIYYAMEILAISRIDDALAAVGIARKALWEAYKYACRRDAFGKRLVEHTLLKRDFIELESELEGALILSLLAAKAFSNCWSDEPPYSDDYHYARMHTHIAKNIASETAANITRYAMEILGGRGFLSEFPMEKFHRDALVTSIWEGTSNIQALDLLELLLKKQTQVKLYSKLEEMTKKIEDTAIRSDVMEVIERSKKEVESMLRSNDVEFYGKDILNSIGIATAAVHLFDAALTAKDTSMKKMAMAYLSRHGVKQEKISVSLLELSTALKWMEKH